MARFIIKHSQSIKPSKPINEVFNDKKLENNITENKTVMTTSEKIEMAKSVLTNEGNATPIKRVKKDKGLIERAESSKTILTEDNKELLND
jgi:hypothetical protein